MMHVSKHQKEEEEEVRQHVLESPWVFLVCAEETRRL